MSRFPGRFTPRRLLTHALIKPSAVCLLFGLLLSGPALADTTVNTGTTRTQKIGSGKSDSQNVTIQGGANVNVGDQPAISLGSGASFTSRSSITIGAGAVVQNRAVRGQGSYGTGANTIEVGSFYDITLEGSTSMGGGARVITSGSQTSAEAINVHGYGNTITIGANAEVISQSQNAAIWFEDTTYPTDPAERNTVINYGSITHTAGGNVFGSQGKSGEAGIYFENYGLVSGNLSFGGGDDDLVFYDQSTVLGTINGGGGNNTLTLTGHTQAAYLTGKISNFSTLNKNDVGLWSLSGALADFGTVNVNNGILQLTGNNSDFHGTLNINPGTATLWARAQSLPTASGGSGGTITNDGILRIDQQTGDNGSYAGVISGTGRVDKVGGGVLTLTGVNNYSGGTWIQEGTVAIGNITALSTSGDIWFGTNAGTNGTLQLNADVDIGARTLKLLPGGGTINVTQNYTGTVGLVGNITGTGSLTKTGTGILDLTGSGTVDYTGGTNIQQGTVVINGADDLGSGGLNFGSANTNGTLKINNSVVLDNINVGPINIYRGGGTIDTETPLSMTMVWQNISGDGALTKTGDGVLALMGQGSSFKGGTNIQQGTVQIRDNLGLGTYGSQVSFGDNNGNIGTLRLGIDNITLDPLRVVTLNSGGGIIDTLTYSGEVAGRIVGSGKLTKTGGGTLTLSGNNTFTGGVTVNNGTLAVNSNAALGADSGTLTLNSGTALQLNGNLDSAARPVVLGSGSTGATINTQGYTGTFGGNLSGSTRELLKDGQGVLALHGQNNFRVTDGINVRQGTLAINSNAALGAASNEITLQPDTTLRLDDNILNLARTIHLDGGEGRRTIDTQGYTGYIYGSPGSGLIGGTPNSELHKAGAGELKLFGNNYFYSKLFIDQGTLQVNTNLPNISALNIASGARLEGGNIDGSIGRIGNGLVNGFVLTNAGTLSPGQSDGAVFGTMTILGNYTPQPGAALEIASNLNADSSITSKLVIDGTVTNATPTQVRVVNLAGIGAMTDRGIKIVQVNGANPATGEGAGLFALRSDLASQLASRPAVVGGAYLYYLNQGDAYAEEKKSFFLMNAFRNTDPNHPRTGPGGDNPPLLHPAIPIYEVYPQILAALAGEGQGLPTLAQRVGRRAWLNDPETPTPNQAFRPESGPERVDSRGLWLRLSGLRGDYQPELASEDYALERRAAFDLNFWRLNFGLDHPLWLGDNGDKLMGGLNAGLGRGRATVESEVAMDTGRLETNLVGAGVSLTWYSHTGWYLDGQARFNNYWSDLSSDALTAESQVDNIKARNKALSLEAGRTWRLGDHWALTPQAQIYWSNLTFGDFQDAQYTHVHYDDLESLRSRLGLGLSYDTSARQTDGSVSRTHIYGLADYYHEFKGQADLNVGTGSYEAGPGQVIEVPGLDFKSRLGQDWVGLAVGGTHNWGDDQFSVYGEIQGRSNVRNFEAGHELAGELGFRIMF